MRPRWLIVFATGCFEPGVYECVGDGSCDAGTCEPTGFCSHSDPDCDSGRRYSALAGDGLAGQCVDAPDPTTSTSTTDDTTTIPTTSSTTAVVPDVAPICGDGNVDPGEACDDGNDVPADGCSPECIASGTILWETISGDPFGGSDAALDVAVLAPEDIMVAGRVEIAADEYLAVYARHDATGVELWRHTYNSSEPSDMAIGIIVNGSNDVIVAGTSGTFPDTASSWVRRVAPNGTASWTVIPDIVLINAIAANGGGAFVAGRGLVDTVNTGAVVLGLRENDGAQLWRGTFPEATSFTALTRLAENDSFLGASIAGDIALVRGGATGLVELDRFVGPFGGEDRPQTVAVLGGAEAIALGGFINTSAGPDWWLRAYDNEVAERWTRSETQLALPLADEIEDLAFVPDGTLYALGFVTNADEDILVAKFDLQGEIVWSRVFPDEADNFGDDIGRALAIALDGSLIVAGERSVATDDRDAWVAKLVQ